MSSFFSMNYSSTQQQQQQQQQQKNSLLLSNQEANMVDWNDKLLLPSSTRTIKRRTSLLEKSRDWARRLMTLHRPRRNTTSNDKIREICSKLVPSNKSSDEFLSSNEKNFDEDGYLSPMEIKTHLDNLSQENQTNPLKLSTNSSHPSPLIYRYHDPNLPPMKRYPTTSFVSEFQKSLSIVDYIDSDLSDELPIEDDPLESIKYLFSNSFKQISNTSIRRLPRRPTNISSVSTDSGYSDMPAASKIIPVQILSCSLIPVNVHCLTCTCRPSSTTCLINQSHSQLNHLQNGCAKNRSKSHSTMTIYPTKINSINKRTNLSRHSSITDDLIAISRWYKPYLEREAVHNVLQQADYGAFILRNSSTHADCYALSIKVPKFTHDSNIVHYLIEKHMLNDRPSYRIKGTFKQFPTLLALLTHHSVMPEILPITLNLNESFTV